MKTEPLQKPPPLLLPGKNHCRNLHDRAHGRFAAKYDNFNGIIKRVSEMKLGLDDECSAESEKSESSSVLTRSSRSSGVPYSSGEDEGISVRTRSSRSSSGVAYSSWEDERDESSASSVTESELCPPYEEIPKMATATNRYSGSSLPSPPLSARSLRSFRDSFPNPPSPATLYSNEPPPLSRRSTSQSLYNDSEPTRLRVSRPSSMYSNPEKALSSGTGSSLYSNSEQTYINTKITENSSMYRNTPESAPVTDLNDNETVKQRLTEDITDAEIHQIEIFFRGLRTQVWVSSCLANLYVSQKGEEDRWTFLQTGVPVLILESGDTKSRSKRRIQIVLAERGTSFAVWSDTIDNLSSYQKANTAFHTMYLSTDHRKVMGLSFASEDEANKLMKQVEVLTADPENINISVPKKKKKKKFAVVKKAAPPPTKKLISKPCLFEHVTSIAARDKPDYVSLQTLVNKESAEMAANIA